MLYRRNHGAHRNHADRLAAVLSLDMAQWWTPSVEGFYGHLPKAGLLAAMANATAAAPMANLKKVEAARMAARALKDGG
jgi:ParB family transcriptional regulator, chromosome partitioning protein